MTFKIDAIEYDPQEGCLRVVYEGQPSAEEDAVVNAMMNAFLDLIEREEGKAEKFMLLFEQGSREVH